MDHREYLKSLRQKHNITQKQMAEKLGVYRTTYTKYENGDRKIPQNIMYKLDQIFNTEEEFLNDMFKNLSTVEVFKEYDLTQHVALYEYYEKQIQEMIKENNEDLPKVIERFNKVKADFRLYLSELSYKETVEKYK